MDARAVRRVVCSLLSAGGGVGATCHLSAIRALWKPADWPGFGQCIDAPQRSCCPTMSFMGENPERALLVIDVQNEYFTGKLPITYPAGSLTNVLSAMDAAREHGVPVVAIQHASPQPDAPVFRKGS